MAKRGRKSTAELATAPVALDAARQRPPAPDDLTKDQREVWKKTVHAMPANWFTPEHHETLKAYCRHAIRARDLSKRIDDTETEKLGLMPGPSIGTYEKVRRMAEAETRAMLACARSLRISMQSQLRAETAATKRGSATAQRPPWWD